MKAKSVEEEFLKSEIVKRLGEKKVLETLMIFMKHKEGMGQEVIDYIIHDDSNNEKHRIIRANILNGFKDYLNFE